MDVERTHTGGIEHEKLKSHFQRVLMIHHIELFGYRTVQKTLEIVYDTVAAGLGRDTVRRQPEIGAFDNFRELLLLLGTGREIVERLYDHGVVALVENLDRLHASLRGVFVENEHVLFPVRIVDPREKHRDIECFEERKGDITFEKLEKRVVLLAGIVTKSDRRFRLFLYLRQRIENDGNSVFVEKDDLLHGNQHHGNMGRADSLHILHRYELRRVVAVQKPLRRKERDTLFLDGRSHSIPTMC